MFSVRLPGLYIRFVINVLLGGWCCLLTAHSGTAQAVSYTSDTLLYRHSYHALFTPQPITIDGNLDDWSTTYAVGWSTHDKNYAFSPEAVHQGGLKENVVTMKVRWDTQKLYVAFQVYDSYLHAPDTSAYFETDDAIEFYLSTAEPGDPRYAYMTDREYQFMVNAVNSVRTLRGLGPEKGEAHGNRDFDWQVQIESKAAWQGTLNNHEDLDFGLTYELAIPWSVLNYLPTEGDTLFMDGVVGDIDPGIDCEQSDWAGIRIFAHANRWLPLVLTDEFGVVPRSTALIRPALPGSTQLLLWILLPALLVVVVLLGYRLKRNREFHPPTPEEEPASASLPTALTYVPTELPGRTTSEKIDESIELIKRSYYHPLKLAEVAADLNLPKEQLQEGLKQRTGYTFKSLVTEIRLEECARLLKVTDTPIVQIGYHLGFNDPSTLRRSFKNKFDMSPRAYRKAQQGTSS